MYVDSELCDAAEKTARHLVEKHKDRLSNNETRRSFYMQELDGASRGDKQSRKWAKSKGVDPSQYKDALMDDNLDAEKVQIEALYSAMVFPPKDRAVFKCLLVDNMMEQSEGFINAGK